MARAAPGRAARDRAAIGHAELSFLKDTPLQVTNVAMELSANRAVGVPYTDEMLENAAADLKAQADPNADTSGISERYPKAKIGDFDGECCRADRDGCALVAYLQMLGTLVDFSTYDDRWLPLRRIRWKPTQPCAHFADSWGLLAMTLFFIGVVLFTLRPGARKAAEGCRPDPSEGGLIDGETSILTKSAASKPPDTSGMAFAS
jgi:hypothetical protein